MGTAEIENQSLTIYSHIITYGNAADEALTALIAEEIETMWNEPNGHTELYNNLFRVQFKISYQYNSLIPPNSIIQNENPKNNYFRIETFCNANISFVDAIGSNTGYFLMANLYKGSTSAAHEYGHSLGLPHPKDLNIIGKGVPSIMYPRGTLLNQEFQNDTTALPNGPGGTLNPQHRKVMQNNIDDLKLNSHILNGKFVLGKITNIYHEAHKKMEQ